MAGSFEIALRAITAALSIREGREDMVLVPREPTEAMKRAGTQNDHDGWTINVDEAAETWRAMLAAAPPQALSGEGVG